MTGTVAQVESPSEGAGPQPTELQLLVTLIRQCALSGIGRTALLLRISRLPATLRRPHHVRLARQAVEPLRFADRARIYHLSGADIVVVWRGDATAILASATSALDRLFEGEQVLGASATWKLFDLPSQADELLASLRPTASAPPSPSRLPPGRLDIRALAALETALASVDVARFVRRRRVCALTADGSFRLQWERRVLSVRELTDALAPDCAVQADPWLFRRLTRTLDQRMLSLLAAPLELRGVGAFSFGLNVASLLSPSFLRFDAALPASLRGHVALELLPADVLGDLSAFVFARDFARERGYRLLLRDIDADLLPVLPLGRIGLDLMQLRWTGVLAPLVAAGSDLDLPDGSRCVLLHADTREAVEWGRARGITLFQGRAVAPS
jgi:hypothetical protein